MKNFTRTLIVTIALSLLLPVSSFAKRKFSFDKDFIFKDGNVEIKVEKAEILVLNSGMTLTLLIMNNGTEEYEFNASDFEVLDPKTKQAFYSCTKDKDMVSAPHYLVMQNILTNNTAVKADRAVKGIILIFADTDALRKLKAFELNFKGQTLKMTS